MKRISVRCFSQAEFLPSRHFMHRHVLRPSQKERFVQIASEIKIYKDVYKSSGNLQFDDGMWKVLMDMLNWEERYKYLIELQNVNQEKSEEEKEEDLHVASISERNEERLKNGEMVYARNFHSLLDIYGSTFRRQIDTTYGLNLINQENAPSFIVDCRFLREYSVKTQAKYIKLMQVLHDENWFSKKPFNIHFANYQPDNQMAELAKKMLLFQYGPTSQSEEGKVFKRHPFAPNLTARRINQIVPKENLMYISPKATRFLPDKIPQNIQGVVYCFSNESSPATSSATACIVDKVQPYRIPIKKYCSTISQLPLPILSRVFRDYFEGSTIGESILHNTKNMQNRQRDGKGDKKVNDHDLRNEEFRSAMHHINNCSQSNHT